MTPREHVPGTGPGNFIVKYTDRFGRVCFGQVVSPVEFFADRIATGEMSSKSIKDCEVFEVVPVDLGSHALQIQARTKRLLLLIRVKDGGPGSLAEMVNKKDITPEEAAQLRLEIIQRWPFDSSNFTKDAEAVGTIIEQLVGPGHVLTCEAARRMVMQGQVIINDVVETNCEHVLHVGDVIKISNYDPFKAVKL